eukprot:TRINITY_DN13198_c0_g1_i9.p2 TRINITY_DN13198_c0_g1~~TRINITY_DN13198_c0_g1_i9.p2  ORF type:complete len:100 (-),score=20.24 TRINITY_DN13198_c0_g1_i9:71-370(-)
MAVFLYTAEWVPRKDSSTTSTAPSARPCEDSIQPFFPYLKLLLTALSKFPPTSRISSPTTSLLHCCDIWQLSFFERKSEFISRMKSKKSKKSTLPQFYC